MLEAICNDIRYAARSLRRTPSFAIAAVTTLALGIGANTAMFSVVYGVILQPLPYRDSGRLVAIETERNFAGRRVLSNYSLEALEAWRTQATSFESVAFAAVNVYAVPGDDTAEVVTGAMVSRTFFETLSGPFVLGRPLGADDDTTPVAVISNRLWQQRYGGSPGVIGRQITLTGQPYTIVGVAAASFQVPDARADVWIPAGFARIADPQLAMPGYGGFNPVARLRDGVSVDRATVDAAAVVRALAREDPDQYKDVTASVVGLQERLVGSVRPALRLLFAAVGLVLLVACANLANLLLARRASRARETAIRRALGADRTRLIRETVSEAAVLAVPGTALGILVAQASVDALRWLEPAGLPRLDNIAVNTTTLLFAATAALITSGLAGVIPALLTSADDSGLSTQRSGNTDDAHSHRLRSIFVAGELAVSVVLLVGALLLGRSLSNLLDAPLGISTEGVVAGELNVAMGRTLTTEQQVALADDILDRVRAIPSVEAAGIGKRMRVQIRYPGVSGEMVQHLVQLVPASPGFFRALDVPLLQGRAFAASDVSTSLPVMLLSASAARTFFGTADPIGRTLPLPAMGGRGPVTIVGVVGDVKYAGLDVEARGVIYRPFAQTPFGNMFLVVRSSGNLVATGAALKRAVGSLDRRITVSDIRPLDDYVADAAAQPRFRTVVLMTLASVALGLAIVGLYGVVSYAVARRTSEIGVRIALGARSSDVLGMVIRDAMRLVVTGSVAGVLGALAAARLLRSLLFGVVPSDPVTYMGAVGILATVALIACYIPARRASRVDPVSTLRAE